MRLNTAIQKFGLQSFITLNTNLPKSTKFPLHTNRTMSTNAQTLDESKTLLKDIFAAGINSVLPDALIRNKIKFKDSSLYVADQTFQLKDNVYLVGFGKAVMRMAIVLEQLLGDTLKKGIVSVPPLSKDGLWKSKDMSVFPKLVSGVVQYCEGGENNQPDNRSLETTHNIIDLVESLTENDTLIVLISGGGSALLYMPRPIIDCDDKLLLCQALQKAGADIKELNTVRRKLSMVKGGGLARMSHPASTISLILSDIVGDPLDLIASGPTVYNEKAPEEVVAILQKYNLYKSLGGDLKALITSKETFDDKPLLNSAKEFTHVNNIILGSNAVALEAARLEVLRKKLTPIVLRNDVVGDVHNVSLAYVHVTSLICLALEKSLEKSDFFEKVRDIPILSLTANKVDEIYSLIEDISSEGVVLIGGGEPTVVVKGSGKGGRNQELALHFSLDWLAKIKSYPLFSEYEVIMLSAGTDGQDGPTDAAGAFGYPAMGPIIHDLYMRIKSMAAKEILRKEPRKNEETEMEGAIEEKCKAQVLSGFLTETNMSERTASGMLEDESASNSLHADDIYRGINPLILRTMEAERLLPENTLKNNDSYNFYSRFKKGADLVKTGLTGTNVMDLHFIYIRKRNCSCRIDYSDGRRFENSLDAHDLHIDLSTIEKYEKMHAPLRFQGEKTFRKQVLPIHSKIDEINIKIIDDNLADPCCRKDRKFPVKDIIKDKDLQL